MTEKEVNHTAEVIDPSSPEFEEAQEAGSSNEGDADESVESSVEEAAKTVDLLSETRLEAARLKDMWMRTAAEFDNFRKRSRKESEDARKAGQEDILRELLPVFDNLERGIQSAQRTQDVKAVTEGLQMIVKQFESTIGRLGITKVPAVGIPFNPAVHEAIQQVETDQHPSGTVIFEVQPGYLQGEKLLRASMVVVAKAKAPTQEGDSSAEGQPS